MKALWEVYTDDKTLKTESINEFLENAKQLTGYNIDEIARYVCQDDNGRNTLVECQVPTKDAIECTKDETIYLVGYEFDGDIEDYEATREVFMNDFNGDWSTLKKQMMELAKIR